MSDLESNAVLAAYPANAGDHRYSTQNEDGIRVGTVSGHTESYILVISILQRAP